MVSRYFRKLFMEPTNSSANQCHQFVNDAFNFLSGGLAKQDGFSNPSHRCFINTAVQAMFSSTFFCAQLKRVQFKSTLLIALQKIGEALAKCNSLVFTATIQKRTANANDMQAAMDAFIQRLPADMQGQVPKSPADIVNIVIQAMVDEGIREELLRVKTQITQHCSSCKASRELKITYLDGLYNIPHEWQQHTFGEPATQEYTMEDIFNYSFMDNTASRICWSCKVMSKVTSQHEILSMPNVIFMFLNRRSVKKNEPCRLNVNIKPDVNMQLGAKEYNTQGFFLHQASSHTLFDMEDKETYIAHAGHWQAIKVNDRGNWECLNDDEAYQITPDCMDFGKLRNKFCGLIADSADAMDIDEVQSLDERFQNHQVSSETLRWTAKPNPTSVAANLPPMPEEVKEKVYTAAMMQEGRKVMADSAAHANPPENTQPVTGQFQPAMLKQCKCGAFCNPVYYKERGDLLCDKDFILRMQDQDCTHTQRCKVFHGFKCNLAFQTWSVFQITKGLSEYNH